MSEFKGTKGKWEISKGNNVFADGKIIFSPQSDFSNMEIEANAKLIATAPEMLEMLKDIIENTDRMVQDGQGTETYYQLMNKA